MASTSDNIITSEPSGRGIGTTTIGAFGGAGVAGAGVTVLLWVLTTIFTGLVIPIEVVQALTTLFTAGGALIGGYITPTNKAKTETHIVQAPITSQVTPNLIVEDLTRAELNDTEFKNE